MKQFFTFIAFLMMAMSLSVVAQNYDFSAISPSGHTLYYKFSPNLIDTDGVYITYPNYSTHPYGAYNKPAGDLIIPDSVSFNGRDYAVKSIDLLAFSECFELVSVIIPNTVVAVSGSAFLNCTGLTTVCLGTSVMSIGSQCFRGCSSLTSINLPNSLRGIENAAFFECVSLSSVDIPSSVTNIGNSAFFGCTSLSTASLPNTITSMGSQIFEGCSSLLSVNIPSSISTIPSGMLRGCSRLSSIYIPENINVIGASAFYGCTGLHDIQIPNSVTRIASSAFYGCSNIDSIFLPNSLTIVGNNAFHFCANLVFVQFGNNALTIGEQSFYGCSLTTIKIMASNPPSVSGAMTFGNHPEDILLQVPCESVFTYQTTDFWNRFTEVECIGMLSVYSNDYSLGGTQGGGTCISGDVRLIYAIPTPGARFVRWSNDSPNNPQSILFVGDTIITAFFSLRDTLVVYDTTMVTDTLRLTEYVSIHDTTYINVPVYDTTIVTDTVTLTEYVPMHDTTYIDVHDTTNITLTDTVTLTQYDTIRIYDTIIIHDTIVVGVDDVWALNAKIYTHNGQIVVEGSGGNAVWLYDVNGRILATKQDYGTPIRFDAPASGTYMIKIGDNPARKIVVIR